LNGAEPHLSQYRAVEQAIDFCRQINGVLEPPSGEAWLHEIKYDGFRVIARKDDKGVRLYSRPGNDLTYRFPLIVESMARLRPRSCITTGRREEEEDWGR
jgi:ATP-dependent DNA ligase